MRLAASIAPRLILALAALPLVSAQADPTAIEQSRLDAARRASAAAAERARVLDSAASAARDAATEARIRREAVAARVEEGEADIRAASARLALIDRRLAFERERLAVTQAPTLRLVAALQSLARRPALAAVAQPGTTADLVHVRAALATVVPAVVERSASVRTAIARTDTLRDEVLAARRDLGTARAELERERVALAQAESRSRLRSVELARTALVESDRAIALGEAARDIVDQIDVAAAAADTRAALATLDGPMPRPDASLTGPAGASPYRLPVDGRLVTGLGEVSDNGVRSRGLTIATRPGAPVVAPSPGRVVFARSFRSYGTVVILDHGDGWSTLVSGLAHAGVRRGDRVAAGVPIGRAPAGERPAITVELRRRGRPIDLVALLG